jgi:hypothetical protein
MNGQNDEETRYSREGHEALSSLSGFRDTVINSLGEAAIQALGLKALPNAPKDLMARLQNDLGAHAFKLLESQGIIQQKPMKARIVMRDYFGMDPDKVDELYPEKIDKEGIDRSAEFNYVEFAREGYEGYKPRVLAQIEAIKTANKYSGAAVDKLFNAEKLPTQALQKPTEFTQEFAQRTQQGITEEQRKVLNASQQVPHHVIPEMFKLAMALGKDALLTAAGKVDAAKTFVHIENQRSIEAQNDNLSNQYDLMMEMLGTAEVLTGEDLQALLDQKFYILHNVWKNYRVGIDTQSLNQQSSKLHRFMFSRPTWKATIDFSNEELLNEFKISVAQALGAKIDKTPNATTLKGDDVREIFETPDSKWQKAAAIIRAGVLEGKDEVWTDESRAMVADLSASKEGMMTLQGLMALAQYQQALDNGKKPFEVTLLVGADGKTNGPILTHLALGAAEDKDALFKMLNRGGMYSNTDTEEHYSEFAAKGGLDLYEMLAKNVLTRVFSKQGDNPAFAAFQMITKPLIKDGGGISSAGRNLMKTPMTSA